MLIIAKRIIIFIKVPGVYRGGALALATWAWGGGLGTETCGGPGDSDLGRGFSP
jgi:hypothetical protein